MVYSVCFLEPQVYAEPPMCDTCIGLMKILHDKVTPDSVRMQPAQLEFRDNRNNFENST